MRRLDDHLTGVEVSDRSRLKIFVLDDPGSDGTHRTYDFGLPSSASRLIFQNGNPEEVGVNGVTDEALIAVVIDRLRCYRGVERFRESQIAMTRLEEALMWLKK